ncbi:hypothetical protein [Streptomyces sp. NPDC060194]
MRIHEPAVASDPPGDGQEHGQEREQEEKALEQTTIVRGRD